MSESSLTPEAEVTFFKATVLAIILVPSSTLLIGDFIAPLNAPWGVCVLVFGLTTFTLRRHHAFTLTIQCDAGNFETAQLLTEQVLSDHTSQNIDPEPFMRSITCALKNVPRYCTPLDMLNQMSSETSELDSHDVPTTFATFEGFGGECTFTSPPMCTMEIFVRKEETVVYEDITAYISSGTPSPLFLDHDLPGVDTPSLTELIKRCQATIIESNLRDMELL